MQVAFDNTQLVRVILSRSNIKVTFLKKWSFGGISVSQTHLVCLIFLQTEGPLYWAAMSIIMLSPEKWKSVKVKFIEKLVALAHIRNTVTPGTKT